MAETSGCCKEDRTTLTEVRLECGFNLHLRRYNKAFKDINSEVARYRMLLLYLGTAQDTNILRTDLVKTRRGVLNAIVQGRMELVRLLEHCFGAAKHPYQTCKEIQSIAWLYNVTLEFFYGLLRKATRLIERVTLKANSDRERDQGDDSRGEGKDKEKDKDQELKFNIKTGLKEVYMLKGRNSIVPLTLDFGNLATGRNDVHLDGKAVEEIQKDMLYVSTVIKEVTDKLSQKVVCPQVTLDICHDSREDLDEIPEAQDTLTHGISDHSVQHTRPRSAMTCPRKKQLLCLVFILAVLTGSAVTGIMLLLHYDP